MRGKCVTLQVCMTLAIQCACLNKLKENVCSSRLVNLCRVWCFHQTKSVEFAHICFFPYSSSQLNIGSRAQLDSAAVGCRRVSNNSRNQALQRGLACFMYFVTAGASRCDYTRPTSACHTCCKPRTAQQPRAHCQHVRACCCLPATAKYTSPRRLV